VTSCRHFQIQAAADAHCLAQKEGCAGRYFNIPQTADVRDVGIIAAHTKLDRQFQAYSEVLVLRNRPRPQSAPYFLHKMRSIRELIPLRFEPNASAKNGRVVKFFEIGLAHLIRVSIRLLGDTQISYG
jgi:hypothetical protein